MTDLQDWKSCLSPDIPAIDAEFICIEPYTSAVHAEPLYSAICGAGHEELWRYIPLVMPANAESLDGILQMMTSSPAHGWRVVFFADPRTNEPLGTASYMRIRPEHGSAEVGNIILSPKLQRTRAATQAMYLMASYLFDDLGYRRYEWKCNEQNNASKRAALRLGFTYEGTFRNDMVVKGENRDTAWFSITDTQWPAIKAALEAWMAPENFDENDQQRKRIEEFRS